MRPLRQFKATVLEDACTVAGHYRPLCLTRDSARRDADGPHQFNVSRSVMNRPAALRLALALCMITTAVNLQAPLYDALAARDGVGAGATSVAFACYVLGVFPVLLALNGLADRVGRKPMIIAALCLALMATLLTMIFPGLISLAVARLLMGVGTAMTSAVAPGWMLELFPHQQRRRAANWVTAATSLGFGLGAAVTGIFVMQTSPLQQTELVPPSLWLYLGGGSLALILVLGLEDNSSRQRSASMLRLPVWPPGSLPFGLAIMLAWAMVGLVITLLPTVLAQHGLSGWSGFAVFGICSCGVLFQPLARQLSPQAATRLGLLILPPAYALISWGALEGVLAAILIGTVAASSTCYGFIYLGGMSGALEAAGERASGASAGFFLMAYIGFSLPVVFTGMLMDRFGHSAALQIFGVVLVLGVMLVSVGLMRINQAEKSRWQAD
ncbi:MFS transporter [Halomonas cupida]|uniref:MFS transporter n=1 Tax=Halomonas cupida TaxID=44933 RepID=UPI0039B4D4BB